MKLHPPVADHCCEFVVQPPEPLSWIGSFRMQVAARSPRLAECFEGAHGDGRHDDAGVDSLNREARVEVGGVEAQLCGDGCVVERFAQVESLAE